MSTGRTYVLLHGAFRGGWYWRPVVERLRARGHRATAPTLTGSGERRHVTSSVNLETHVTDLEKHLFMEDVRDAVLVAHSYGGVVATAAAPLVEGRVAEIAYLDAAVPRDGERAVDLVPRGFHGRVTPPEAGSWVEPRRSADSRLSEAVRAWLDERLTPFPIHPSLSPVSVHWLPRVRYAFCEHTPPFFPAALMRARCEESGVAFHRIPAGHDAPVEVPDLVVDWITSENLA